VVVAEAASSALSTYVLNPNGTLRPVASTANGQAALCWVARSGSLAFGANSGSATVTSYRLAADGTPRLLRETSTDAGPIDIVSSGRFVYLQAGGAGVVDEFRAGSDGRLHRIGSVSGLAGQEGITAA
jgi:hypothetical protein